MDALGGDFPNLFARDGPGRSRLPLHVFRISYRNFTAGGEGGEDVVGAVRCSSLYY